METVKLYCLTLDLKDDPKLIAEYEKYHANVWPGIVTSIKEAGIINMEIFRAGNRLFMIMETEPGFNFDKKAAMDASSPEVQEWEQLMWKYQQAVPSAKPGEKWVLMDKIFSLNKV